MDFGSLGERKRAIFCVIPINDASMNYLIGMLYTQCFQELYYWADEKYNGRLPVPVRVMGRTKAALMTAATPAHGGTGQGRLPNSTVWNWAGKKLWRIILEVLLHRKVTSALKCRAHGQVNPMFILHIRRSMCRWSRGGKRLSGTQ